MICLGLLLMVRGTAAATPSTLEPLMDGVYVVRDDSGQWTRNMSLDITHQVKAEYQAKKVLDLSRVPDDVWAQAKEVRLSAQFGLRDYSWHDLPQENGLDEQFEIVVNGKVHTYPTNCGAPAWVGGRTPVFGWYDFILPKEEFTRGVNEIVLRKAQAEKNDDYLYLCIDTTVPPANSYVAFSGNQWTQDKLTVPGGNGEYMVRLLLITKDLTTTATWQPGAHDRLDDPAGLVVYRGSRNGQATAAGLLLQPGQSARMEWQEEALDQVSPMSVQVEATGEIDGAWLDEQGKPGEAKRGPARYLADLPAGRTLKPSGFVITAADQPVTLSKMTLSGTKSCHPVAPPVDMTPAMSPPARTPERREPACSAEGEEVVFEDRGLRCRFSTEGDRLRLVSMYNAWTDCEMVRHPEEVALFLVEVAGKRYAGSRDFRLEKVDTGKEGLTATLRLDEPALTATLRIGVEREGLRMGMSLANAGQAPLDFKLAFPHLAGLAVSDQPAEDYYFYPWGGGIFSDRPAIIRRGYGDHEALYQVMDLYSPQRGGGLAIRADDAEGWHKVLALRKHVPGQAEFGGQVLSMRATEEYQWTNPFEAVEGTSLAYEYLRRTRAPGESFAPADAVLWAHAGDWHAPMADYAAWAHRVWEFRPYPSRLGPIVHMIAAGWDGDMLYKDGAYRTDFIKPNTDCIELMSWWDWSPLGPWRTPIDKVAEVLGEGAAKLWQPYFVKDPVTGEAMWNNQPGDYDGYNERFGGLPAFRKAIQTYKDMGALVTLYTDPFRMDDGSKIGQAKGKEWGVVLDTGEHSKAYDVWNPCHDDPDVREWVADTMERVMRETGADGIRLDEYGHRGFVCYSDQHQHTYAERGITQWQKTVAETTKMVRERMDKVAPGSVLTTEHPGYDYLMQFIDGCITYDLTVQKTELRPLEVNLQRFYFPECKAYELDHQRADVEHKKRFWNGVASFGSYYPTNMYCILRENEGVFGSRDCEALVPTLVQRVYANRFGGGGQIIYMLYNATGHTVDAPVLPLNVRPGQHAFDLLNCTPCDIVDTGRAKAVGVYLERDDVACIAVLPRKLDVKREGAALTVQVAAGLKEPRLEVCDMAGDSLLMIAAREGRNRVDLSAIEGDKQPACLRLLDGTQLVDVVEVEQAR
jgi:hypothetical protein